MTLLDSIFGSSRPQDVPSPPTKGDPNAELVVVSFPRFGDEVTSMSPFGGKVEMILRIAGLDFKGVVGDITNKKHAPKGKFPVLMHGDNVVADSSCIFEYLRNTYPDKMKVFDAPNATAAAVALAAQKLLEEDVYFCEVYCHWYRDDGAQVMLKHAFEDLPGFLQPFVPRIARAGVLSSLHGQGTSRHSWEFLKERLHKGLAACNTLLADGPYLSGKSPSQADCFLFGQIESILNAFPEITDPAHSITQMRDIAVAYSNVIAFHSRLRKQYWPDGKTVQWTEAFRAGN